MRGSAGSTSRCEALVDATDRRRSCEELGLDTVGDLLRHYPRRYVERGELTPLADLAVGEHVTVVGRVVRRVAPSRRSRSGTRSQGDGRRRRGDSSTSRSSTQRLPVPQSCVAGRTAVFAAEVGVVQRQAAADAPRTSSLLGSATPAEEFADRPYPGLPAGARACKNHVGRQSAVRLVLDVAAASCPTRCPTSPGAARPAGLGAALRAIHRPARRRGLQRARSDGSGSRRRSSCRSRSLSGAPARRPRTATPRAARSRRAARRRSTRGCRSRSPTGQRQVGARDRRRPGPGPPDAPAAAGRGRLGQDRRRAARDAAGRRRGRPGRAARAHRGARASSTTARSPRCSARSPRRGMLGGADRHAGRPAHRLACARPPAARPCSTPPAATAGIVVGTHALLQEQRAVPDLGLVVVDEQHRFGVEQRDALREKGDGSPPHVLVMTATPIPRTVAMTVFGDLETSTLRELPDGPRADRDPRRPAPRQPHWLDRAWQRVREEVAAGHQAYVVCPRIGDGRTSRTSRTSTPAPAGRRSDATPAAAAVLEVAGAAARAARLAGLRIEVLHGRMPPEEKDDVMRALRRRARSTSWSPPPSSRSASTCPTPPSWSSWTPTASASPSCTSCAAGSGGAARRSLCLLVTDVPRRDPGARAARPPSRPPSTASSSPASTWSSAARATCSARPSPAARSSLKLLRVLRDEELIDAARHDAMALVAQDPDARGLTGPARGA